MMTVHPEKFDPKYKYRCITWRYCAKLLSYKAGIYGRIDNQMINSLDEILDHLLDF